MNFESHGAQIKSKHVKAEAADANNNEPYFKDRNVPSEYKFTFAEQENASSTTSTTVEQQVKTAGAGVLKPLSMNAQMQPKVSINVTHPLNAYYPHGNSGAMKRGCEDVENENEDDLVNSISSSNSSSRRSPPKKPKFVVTSEEMNEYFNLLHQNEIQHFLNRDSCCLISDKYALAMVFTYFKRAKFNLQEYTKDHFYLALYLASDIEEDVDEYKFEIFPWALGSSWRSKFSGFLRRRDALLRRIGYRAIVSRKCCEEVMSFKSEHVVWKRERAEDHGGATRAYLINRSKRFLLSKSNMEDDELNLPRLPEEPPRPCPLCLINRGWNSATNSINSTVLPAAETPVSSNVNVKSKITGAPVKPAHSDSYTKGYSLIKRQKSSNNPAEYANEPRCANNKLKSYFVNNDKLNVVQQTPKASGEAKEQVFDKESNSENESDSYDNNVNNINNNNNNNKYEKNNKLPASNKFLKIKLSTTELENSHQDANEHLHHHVINKSNFAFNNLVRHSSLVSAEKFLIKDYVNTSEEEEEDEDEDDDDEDNNEEDEQEANEDEDDVFANCNLTSKSLFKKQDLLKPNVTKLRSGKTIMQGGNMIGSGLKKRTNHSLSNGIGGYSLRSHSATERVTKNSQRSKLQIVPVN